MQGIYMRSKFKKKQKRMFCFFLSSGHIKPNNIFLSEKMLPVYWWQKLSNLTSKECVCGRWLFLYVGFSLKYRKALNWFSRGFGSVFGQYSNVYHKRIFKMYHLRTVPIWNARKCVFLAPRTLFLYEFTSNLAYRSPGDLQNFCISVGAKMFNCTKEFLSVLSPLLRNE